MDTPPDTKGKLPDFSQKVVSLSFAAADSAFTIAHGRWEIQGGRLFFVGTVPRGSTKRDWCEGVVSAVAWDLVSDYLVFDSIEDYCARQKTFSKKRK